LTTYNATTGGKNRPPAGAFFVVQPVDARRDKAQRPFADMPCAEFHGASGGGKRLSVGQQQHGTRPFGEGNRGLLFPEPPWQRGARGVIKGNVERGVTSLPVALLGWVVQVCGAIRHHIAKFSVPFQWGSVLRSYRKTSLQGRAYHSLTDNSPFPPFAQRHRSATKDIKAQWLQQLEQRDLVNWLSSGLDRSLPRDFEDMWALMPERLEESAFVLDHVAPHLGPVASHPTVRYRLHCVINQAYFESSTKDLRAGIVTDLGYMQASYQIKSYGRDLSYRLMVGCLREQGLLEVVERCSPTELISLNNDPRWLAALDKTCSSDSEAQLHLRHQSQIRSRKMKSLKMFIVHGHDKTLMLELKDYLQNTLKFSEPVILFQQPSKGRTVIEKFEECSSDVNGAVVLLTPDDIGGVHNGDLRERARQNVIFELGYFVGKFGRRSSRVLLLHRGKLELPSDLAGVVYIDVTNGISAAGEELRRELAEIP
jgi:predicted nucleotide-binding protein